VKIALISPRSKQADIAAACGQLVQRENREIARQLL
jgi:adenine C2-methylase RlmN of 23S rRNA A2503 and tRNA A37